MLQAKETRRRLEKSGVDVYIGKAEFVKGSKWEEEEEEEEKEGEESSSRLSSFFGRLRWPRRTASKKSGPSASSTSSASSPLPVLRVCRRDDECVELLARKVIICTGSRPHSPTHNPSKKYPFELPYHPDHFIDATKMSGVTDLPNAVAVIGGGVIAAECERQPLAEDAGWNLRCVPACQLLEPSRFFQRSLCVKIQHSPFFALRSFSSFLLCLLNL